ncbi:MAG: AMP-binding protein [Chitinophagales bacterium]
MNPTLSIMLQNVAAQSSPDKTALVCQEEAISYRKLQEAWQHWKNTLCAAGLQAQKRVGILANSKKNALFAIGGVILAENVYVPLDKNAPIERNLHIIEDNQLHALLLDKTIEPSYLPHLQQYDCVELEEFYLLQRPQNPILQQPIPDDLAYILNTSGSTGKPKGVMITHDNALSFVDWADETFGFSENDVFASIAPFHFDLSIFDVYVALKNKATLALFEPEETQNPRLLAALLEKYKGSILYATPTLLSALVNYGKLQRYDHSALRCVFFAGEVFPIPPLRKLKTQWEQARFFNLYGPTETNVCTWFEIPSIAADRLQPFPIGKDCSHIQTKIMNNEAEGELLVSGRAVTPGYWQQMAKSQAVLEKDENDTQWYKTGDIVKRNEAGDYVFLGRRDRMVKRRGYRIELDEIEKCIGQNVDLEQVAVVAHEAEQHQIVIICYYKLKQNHSPQKAVSSNELREYSLSVLPIYMLPDKFEALENIPTTSTQKVNYQALLAQVQK